MKKVLFIMPSMFIGGAERSLLGLLEAFDYSQYEAYLFLYRHEGEFMNLIPEKVHILPAMKEYATFDVPIKNLIKGSLKIYGIARLCGKCFLKIRSLRYPNTGVWAEMQYISRSLQPFLPEIPGEYDLAISFLGVPDVLLNKACAKKKVAWNHTDYAVLGPDKRYDRFVYRQLDGVVSVSEPCTKQLLKCYPELNHKSYTIGNILSKQLIECQADEPIGEINKENTFTILSIGRFSDAKNFDNVPDICRRLLHKGLKVKWYLIGYGGDEELIRRRIIECKMDKDVVILGKKDNPYPYIKACDLYVQPSRYEGKCVSVIEAQILCKPVVITNYATSASQLEDGVDGVIVPLDNEGCAEGIARLLRDPLRMKELADNCAQRDYTNSSEINKIYGLLSN